MAASKENLQKLLADADKTRGFPPGTMASIWKQETGGSDKYLNDPSAYHYAAGPDGRRIAGHTGKVSTAFGPFGILESTARDPGYGVAPLKDKSLEEQIRFSADYLAGRSKAAGGLAQGLAGYGEGDKYAKQVLARRDGGASVSRETRRSAPVAPDPEGVLAQAPSTPATVSEGSAPGITQLSAAAPAVQAPPSQDALAWQRFQEQAAMASQAQAQAQENEALQMTQRLAAIGGGVPQFQVGPMAPRAVDFRAFGNWGRA